MDITFLIGNGFDIRMGLKTSFRDVCNHYISLPSKNDDIRAFKKELDSDKEYWSDFELAMGKLTANYIDKPQTVYKDRIADFTTEMIRYLGSETAKIDYLACEAEIKKEFLRSAEGIFGELQTRYRNEINSIINIYKEKIIINFISFNYTDVLDECLKIAFDKNPIVGKHVSGGVGYIHEIKTNVLHVHGTLASQVIMGVDNEDQIKNKNWASQKRFREVIVKPAINDRSGSLVDKEALRLISNSSIVCVFGMSLGMTDQTWWKLIGAGLINNNRKLIIFTNASADSGENGVPFRRFEIENERRDLFFDRAGINEEERALIEDKINVVPGTKLFNIDLVELTKKRKEEIQNIMAKKSNEELLRLAGEL